MILYGFCLRRRMSFLSFCTLNSVNSTLNCIIDNIFLFCTNAASALSGITIQKIKIKTGKSFGHEHRGFKCLIMEAGWAGKSRYTLHLAFKLTKFSWFKIRSRMLRIA